MKTNNQKLGADNWLHILSNAIGNYAEEGGEVVVILNDPDEILVRFVGVKRGDERLNPKFIALVNRDNEPAEEVSI